MSAKQLIEDIKFIGEVDFSDAAVTGLPTEGPGDGSAAAGGVRDSLLYALSSTSCDALVFGGDLVGFAYGLLSSDATWHSATTATYTVPAGKTLVVLEIVPFASLAADFGNRQFHLYNATDGAIIGNQAQYQYAGLLNGLDAVGTPLFYSVPAGKTVVIRAWNSYSYGVARTTGGIVICRVVPAP